MTASRTDAVLDRAHAVLTEAIYLPTDGQLAVKARLWQTLRDQPLIDPKSITCAEAARITGSSVISKWWSNEQFREWFLNKSHVTEQLEVCAEMAMAALKYMLNPDNKVQDSARVNAIKIALEFTGRAPAARKEVVTADKDIANMDAAQLNEFIQRAIASQTAAHRTIETTARPG